MRVGDYERKLPDELQSVDIRKALLEIGTEGVNAARQGIVVKTFHPWWRVVARLDRNRQVEYVVVDVSHLPPVTVFGPDTEKACGKWAKSIHLAWISTNLHLPTWPWE